MKFFMVFIKRALIRKFRNCPQKKSKLEGLKSYGTLKIGYHNELFFFCKKNFELQSVISPVIKEL